MPGTNLGLIRGISLQTVWYSYYMVSLTKKERDQLTAKWGTPLVIYDEQEIIRRVRLVKRSFRWKTFSLLVSVKTNGNVAILQMLRRSGCGADVSSPGDLLSATEAGFGPYDINATGPNWSI